MSSLKLLSTRLDAAPPLLASIALCWVAWLAGCSPSADSSEPSSVNTGPAADGANSNPSDPEVANPVEAPDPEPILIDSPQEPSPFPTTITADPVQAATCEEASGSSVGCEFYAIQARDVGSSNLCFAAYIANTGPDPVQIAIERDGENLGTDSVAIPVGEGEGLSYEPYDPSAGLPSGGVAIAFLAEKWDIAESACPLPAAVRGEGLEKGASRGAAFRLITDRPVAAYSLFPYGGEGSVMASATLLLPTSTWGTDFVTSVPTDESYVRFGEGTERGDAGPGMQIVAREPETTVTLLPSSQVKGVSPEESGLPGMPVTFQLQQGEYVQLQHPIFSATTLSGSLVQADKPIGVWSFHANIAFSGTRAETEQEQLPPLSALGHRYVGIPAHERQDPTAFNQLLRWQLVGAVDGTVLEWTPERPEGAPTQLDRGEVVHFDTHLGFIVNSQSDEHVFHIAQYIRKIDVLADPEFVTTIPTEQYQTEYTFFTDPTYPETSLLVTRTPLADGSYAPVNLECRGELSDWQPLGDLEFARVQLVHQRLGVEGCSNGHHQISSDAPFGVMVWGWGDFVSYGYAAGAGVRTINAVELDPIRVPR